MAAGRWAAGRTAVSASRRGRDPPAAPGPVPAGDTASDRAGAAPHAPNIVSWMSWRLDPRQLLWVCPEKPADALWAAEQILRNGSCGACSAGCPRSAPNRCAGCIWRPRPATCCSSPCVRPPPPPTPRPPLAAGAGAAPGGLSVHILKRRGLPAIRRCTWAWSPAPSKHPPAMRLWIAACLRCLPLDAIRPHWPDDAQAYAVLEQERVIALTRPRALRACGWTCGAPAPPPSRPRSSCCRAVRRPRPTRGRGAGPAAIHARGRAGRRGHRAAGRGRQPAILPWPARTGAPGRRHVAGAGLAVSLGMAPTAAGAGCWRSAANAPAGGC